MSNENPTNALTLCSWCTKFTENGKSLCKMCQDQRKIREKAKKQTGLYLRLEDILLLNVLLKKHHGLQCVKGEI